jgi:hypothetical protein
MILCKYTIITGDDSGANVLFCPQLHDHVGCVNQEAIDDEDFENFQCDEDYCPYYADSESADPTELKSNNTEKELQALHSPVWIAHLKGER